MESGGGEDERCPVCKNDLRDGAPLVFLECAHAIHKECADTMMHAFKLTEFSDLKCPTCRHGGIPLPPVSPTASELDRLVVDSPTITDMDTYNGDAVIDSTSQEEASIIVIKI